MAIDETLGKCIADSIKRKEEESKRAEEERRVEKARLIKEIKEFFKHLPEDVEFRFKHDLVFDTLRPDDDIIVIKQIISYSRTEMQIHSTDLLIEEWDLKWIRIMHRKLPEFEAELRRRYSCNSE